MIAKCSTQLLKFSRFLWSHHCLFLFQQRTNMSAWPWLFIHYLDPPTIHSVIFMMQRDINLFSVTETCQRCWTCSEWREQHSTKRPYYDLLFEDNPYCGYFPNLVFNKFNMLSPSKPLLSTNILKTVSQWSMIHLSSGGIGHFNKVLFPWQSLF